MINCTECKKQIQNENFTDGEISFCSNNCRLNWNFRRINDTFRNHKEEFEKHIGIANSNSRGLFVICVGLIIAVGLLSLVSLTLYFDNIEQDERFVRWANHQRDIERQMAHNSHNLCLTVQKLGGNLTCEYVEDMNKFQWENP